MTHHFIGLKDYNHRRNSGMDQNVAHCGFYRWNGKNVLWFLGFAGIPAIKKEDACPCCLNAALGHVILR